MSTRCQIEFRSGDVRRTMYRHWDGYPSAVIPDLLAFLAWSTRHGDVEYESANFLYWSKRDMDEPQLGFGICANDELHGDVEYYYVVAWAKHGVRITAHAIEHDAGELRLGRVVASAVYTPPARKEETPSATFFNSAAAGRWPHPAPARAQRPARTCEDRTPSYHIAVIPIPGGTRIGGSSLETDAVEVPCDWAISHANVG